VVSLQNHFQKSNDDQISDLVKFNSSKFVHVSSLEIFGSRVFYTIQGFQGYLNCNFWLSRLISRDFTSSAQIL
jgi:hypothetical protein